MLTARILGSTSFLSPNHNLGGGGGLGRHRPGRPIRWESRIHKFSDHLGVAWAELEDPDAWGQAGPALLLALRQRKLALGRFSAHPGCWVFAALDAHCACLLL